MKTRLRSTGPKAGLAAFALLLLAPVSLSQADDQLVEFYAVADLNQDGTSPVLIGGRPARTADFPASYYTRSAGGSCTGTLVAARVLLTAAHCVYHGGSIKFTRGGKTYRGTCTHAPEYSGNQTADWALCLLDVKVPGGKYERVNQDPSLLKENQELLLTGFGCTRKGGGGGNDNVYRIGEAPIKSVPRGNNHDIVTRGEVALCFGDSGGPAFLTPEGESRVTVSTNSRGDIHRTSYLSSLSTPAAIKFVKNWAAERNTKICGVDESAEGCR